MIKALITDATSWEEEVEEFESWDEIIEYMKEGYGRWIIEFDWYKSEESEAEVELIKYDCYVE